MNPLGARSGNAGHNVGDAVTTRRPATAGHHRLPHYLAAQAGIIEALHGTFPLADARALGREDVVEPLYTVAFDARDVWGVDGEPNGTIHAELWESYLERR